MARVPQDVTDAELAVLQVLWSQGASTIRQLMDVLYPEGGPSPFATVQKLLERLAAKECVGKERRDGVNVYKPLIDRDELVGRWLGAMAEKLGEDSLTPLVTHLVRTRLSGKELAELGSLIDELVRKSPRKRRG